MPKGGKSKKGMDYGRSGSLSKKGGVKRMYPQNPNKGKKPKSGY